MQSAIRHSTGQPTLQDNPVLLRFPGQGYRRHVEVRMGCRARRELLTALEQTKDSEVA